MLHLLSWEDLKLKNITQKEITRMSEKEKSRCIEIVKQMKEKLVIYISRPNKDIVNIIAEIHFMLKTLKPNVIEYLIFIPKENFDIIEYMSTNNMIPLSKIENFNVDLIPIDLDLLSLEREDNIKEIYIDKNYSSISDFANAVVKLETCFGKIKYKYIKGDLAQKFCDLVKEKEKENSLRLGKDEILGMVVFDRSVDFLTLMTTNYTCEGLIDENIGINLGRIKIKSNTLMAGLNPKSNAKKNEKEVNKDIAYSLTSEKNNFFCTISCMRHFDALKYIREIRNYYQQVLSKDKTGNSIFNSEGEKNLKEISYFLTNLKDNLLQVENIINYVVEVLFETEHRRYIGKEQPLLSGGFPEDLHDYYDEFLYGKKDLDTLIKLMIIESLTQNGVQGYQKLKREILNIFGFQKIFLFRDLEVLGWLKEKQSSLKNLKNITDFSYSQIYEKFELLNENYSPEVINDCSYVLNGYCPLSLKIIEKAVKGQWNTIIENLKKIPGATSYPENESVISNPVNDKNIILIAFVGGVTYTEIEAIRLLNRVFKEEYLQGKRKQTQFIILTTSILNSKKVLKNLGTEVYSVLNMKMFYEQSNKNQSK